MAVSLGTATTYQLLDEVNARLFARATDTVGSTLEEIGTLVSQFFFQDVTQPVTYMPTVWRPPAGEEGRRTAFISRLDHWTDNMSEHILRALEPVFNFLNPFLMPECVMNPEPMFRIHHGKTSLTLEVNWKAAVQPTPTPPPAEKPATRRRRRRRKPATKSSENTPTAQTKPPTEPRKPVSPPPGIPEPVVEPVQMDTADLRGTLAGNQGS